MECKICNKQFKEKHFNQKCCSIECKRKARAIAVRKYKDTPKGKECLKRWYKSSARIKTEKKYRSKPKSKHLQVIRVANYFKRHPEVKRRGENAYAYRRRGYNAGYMDWEAVENLERRCNMCGITTDLTIDHIKPLSKGGTNDIKNIQILCRQCNSAKGNKYEI